MRKISTVLTKTTYTADGTTSIYAVPFEYLSKSHVQITADGQAVPVEWLSSHSVRFENPPQAGTLIIIERQTPYDAPFVFWTDGSVTLADDLNNQLLQVLYVLQENKQALEGALAYDDLLGAYDALERRISNLADPIDPQDAVTYKIFLEEISILKQRIKEAETAADAAKTDAEAAAQRASDCAEASCACAAESASLAEKIQHLLQDFDQLTAQMPALDGGTSASWTEIIEIRDGGTSASWSSITVIYDGKGGNPTGWTELNQEILDALNPSGIVDISEIDENGEIIIYVDHLPEVNNAGI